ncbi:unnamed protein product [Vitrella brassicaformis CCMP3155]|uniref:Protein kinase domain-containing protein n=1 Tax=Vitrella brassicaformis (strain CCMP3155) TaxID=1169540 RepID=A0A0G4EIS2_VITBC|nr:unnamed protein product [Vitrella brassicaformis CCMP3155]|eukprot:CEL96914.1 unnamed protein product [Vitrella brassicaformis CCMP3155]
MAPEAFRNSCAREILDETATSYIFASTNTDSDKVDVWALGGILVVLHGGPPPFEALRDWQISQAVVNDRKIPDIPANLPKHTKNAIKAKHHK